jgi:N-acetylglucosamine-6-phosphate deacetylase
MIVLSGADLVLPDRIVSTGTLVIDDGRIVEIGPKAGGTLQHHYIVPGFIDLHVHGVCGVDVLDGPGAVARIAVQLPRYGVTAFCPTTVACPPHALRTVLEDVRGARQAAESRGARVLPAHLESNFINPEYRGAQPVGCLRTPRAAFAELHDNATLPVDPPGPPATDTDFTASDILQEIDRAAPDVAIVTLAPELDGGLELTAWLTARGLRASLGHTAATFEQGLEAIAAGARQATHLFNRMAPFGHRVPGLVGAVLQTDEVAAELICDGFHVHPAVIRMAIAAKHPSRILAITDGTAASGMPVGTRAKLGGQPIHGRASAAFLADETLAGSVATMDRVFQFLVARAGLSLVDAVTVCSTTPARELGLVGFGVLAADAVADLVVLDAQLAVVQTYVGGRLVYSRSNTDQG